MSNVPHRGKMKPEEEYSGAIVYSSIFGIGLLLCIVAFIGSLIQGDFVWWVIFPALGCAGCLKVGLDSLNEAKRKISEKKNNR